MKTLTITSLAAATLVGLTVAASANPMGHGFNRGPGGFDGMGFGPGAGRATLAQLDLDKDGKITKAEVEEARLKALASAGDETSGIDIKAFETWYWQQHHEQMVRAFQRLDINGDGKVTADEIKTQADRMFDRFDVNGDGVLSQDDRPAMGRGGRGFGPEEDRGPMMGRQGGPQGGQGQGPMMGRQGGPQDGHGPMMGRQGGPQDGQGPMMGRQGGSQDGQGPMMGRQGQGGPEMGHRPATGWHLGWIWNGNNAPAPDEAPASGEAPAQQP